MTTSVHRQRLEGFWHRGAQIARDKFRCLNFVRLVCYRGCRIKRRSFFQSCVGRQTVWRVVACAVLGVSIELGAIEPVLAADHRIPSSAVSFNCAPVNPGDTVTLAPGIRGPLSIRNCTGTNTNRITIRNDSAGAGPTVIRRATGTKAGFIFNCENCVGVTLDGSNKWAGAPLGKTYGIKVTVTGGAGPSIFLRFGGLSRHITIRNVEIDGAWPSIVTNGSGIRINDLKVDRNTFPGLWRENILLEDNYVHNVALEGMYVGANFKDGDLPVRNVEIRNNIVEDTGFEGINTKSMWEGDNSIHHNQVRRAGMNGAMTNNSAEFSGIKNNAGTVKIYNNWVETTGQHGIQSWTQGGPLESAGRGPFEAHIWNNVIVAAGGGHFPFMGASYGISVGAQNGCEKPVPLVYNNTIINSRQSAIYLTRNVGAVFVRDNLISASGGNPVIAAPSFVVVTNNLVGTVTQMAFMDPLAGNFRLTANSPARNQGSEVFPATDFDDDPRPNGEAADQGAFEADE